MSVTDGARPVRPERPPRSPFAVGLGVGAVALTALTWWATDFSPGAVLDGLSNDNRALQAMFHPDWGQLFSERSRGLFLDTLRMAILGCVGGAVVALPLAMASSVHGLAYRPAVWVLRAFTNVIRAFPDVLWAMLFVAAVGIGNLSGTLALFFFSIAVITKLLADTLDAIDVAPLEAADAAGLSWLKKQRTAVLPQVVPSYVAYVLFDFELCVRGSAVLGLVGAGGIGSRLEFFRNRGDYEQVWGIVMMFVLFVFVLERVSAFVRRRLV